MIMQVTGSIFTFKCWLVEQFLKVMLHPCLGTACQHLFRVCFIISPKGCQTGEFCWLNYCRLLVMLLKYIITNVNNSHQLQVDCSSYRLGYSKNKRLWKSSESAAEELGWFCVFCGEVGHGSMIVMEGRGGTCIFLFMSLILHSFPPLKQHSPHETFQPSPVSRVQTLFLLFSGRLGGRPFWWLKFKEWTWNKMGFVLKMSWHGPVQLRNSPEPCWASSSFIFIHRWSGKVPMSRLRWHWVNWVEWCPCGPCYWQAQDSSLQLRRDHREQMCLKGNHSICSLWPHFVLAELSLAAFLPETRPPWPGEWMALVPCDTLSCIFPPHWTPWWIWDVQSMARERDEIYCWERSLSCCHSCDCHQSPWWK